MDRGRAIMATSQSRRSPLQGRDALFQHSLGGVGQPAVDVPFVRQPEPGRGMGGIAEHIAGGLVDGDRTGIGGGVGLLLACVKLQGLKSIAAHNDVLLFMICLGNKKVRNASIPPGQSRRPPGSANDAEGGHGNVPGCGNSPGAPHSSTAEIAAQQIKKQLQHPRSSSLRLSTYYLGWFIGL